MIKTFPEQVIQVGGGNVIHGVKAASPGFVNFQELYFSEIEVGAVKGWKRHLRMTLNLLVPVGNVLFVATDDLLKSRFQEVIVGESNHQRLLVTPGTWLAFKNICAERKSLVCNVADLVHDPNEIERLCLTDVDYEW